jgi:hypothetical protein
LVKLTLVDGRKGPRDILVLLTCSRQPLTFQEWLFIGLHYLSSEDSYYPRTQGYAGSEYLMNALGDLTRNGLTLREVLRKYQLDETRGLEITDERYVIA